MKPGILALAALCVCLRASSQKTDYSRYVNTFIGSQGTGHTYPGPCMPFGMVQPGPDNADHGWDYTSGYQFNDSLIMGFSQTRANGTGINEFGDVLLQPVVDRTNSNFTIGYKKTTEKASPGYYTVTLNNNVKVELTATERVAFHQYTYPVANASLLVDLQHGLRFLTDSLVLESEVQLEADNKTISGYCHTNNWVNRKYFFTIVFSQAFDASTLLPKRAKDAAPRYLLDFTLKHKLLQVKVALSTVGVDGAIHNMQEELPAWDFNAVVLHAKKVWNSYLGRIEIDAPEKQKVIFYSCMYRLFIQPSNIADVDGRYRGANDVIASAINKEYYSTLSLWDTYRATHPLYTLLIPERVNGFINTLIEHSKASGFLPIWSAWGQDNYCMIGNHAIPVIADACHKGFNGFDANDALHEMIKSTTENHINSNWKLLNQYEYYPFDSLDNEAVSRTLEHGVDDYFVAEMAAKMGRSDVAATYYKRAQYYKHLYDADTKQMRGKDSKGNWRKNFDPLMATSPMNNPGDYTEANAWQYFWTPAQYDVTGMMELLGGKKQFTAQLDSFFTIKGYAPNKHLGQEAMIGQYAHGNEPSHHIAYLYAFSNKPQRGREIITQICKQFYDQTPTGMIGNDDCGQMSAWYIFSTLGFYPANPANSQYVFGMPQVKKAVMHLGTKTFTIINRTVNAAAPISIKLNNQLRKDVFITHRQLTSGGSLVFEPRKQ